jgi:Terpene synthase family 2, C-terminal metal binding
MNHAGIRKSEGRGLVAQSADVELPPMAVYCPIPPAIHPSAAAVEAASAVWLAHYQYFGDDAFRRTLLATKSAEFAARVSPDAITERLQIASDWDYWGFAFDDQSDGGLFATDVAAFTTYAHKLVRLLEIRAPRLLDSDPLTSAVMDISARFAACVSPAQHRRWVQAHRAWLFGVAAQVSATDLDLNQYLTIRLNNAAGEVVTATCELVGGYSVPADEYHSPAVQALTEMSRLLAALDNDFHSYAKTVVLQEKNQQNIIGIIASQDHCSVHTAVTKAISLRDRIMCRFLELSAQSRRLDVDTRRYIQDLEHVVRGNIDWALTVPRYAVQGQQLASTFSIVDKPADSSPHSPGIPSIDWWWNI